MSNSSANSKGGAEEEVEVDGAVEEQEEQKENHTTLDSPHDNTSNSHQAEVKSVSKDSKTYTKIVPRKSPKSPFPGNKVPLEMKRNPQLDKLKMQHKMPLQRSTSLPESSNIPGHKTLHRTGSISDYTKQKLKSSILARKSASLVRKPSITEQEINEILTDPESSQSEEEEDMEAGFKPSDRSPDSEANLEKTVVSTPLTTASVT